MKKEMKWGLATLLLLLGIAAVFIFLDQNAELQQLEQETADSIKQLEERNNPQVVDVSDTQKPPPPDDGREYEWHGTHWDPVDAPKLVDSLFEAPELKSDLPDELPADFPTDAEIQQMTIPDLKHLMDLYTKAAMDLRKTDSAASVRLYNATVPKLWERMLELSDQYAAASAEMERIRMLDFRPWHPQTEESPAVTIEVIPSPDDQNEGGNE